MHLEFYYQAFVELETCRNMGPIPWTAIKDYADEYVLEGFQRDCLFHYIGLIDAAVMKKEVVKRGNK